METGSRVTNISRDEIDRVLAVGFAAESKLGRALFEKQERMLPEGEVWDELDDADRSFWISSAREVIQELKRIAYKQL